MGVNSFLQPGQVDIRELQSLGCVHRDERNTAFPLQIVLFFFFPLLVENNLVEESAQAFTRTARIPSGRAEHPVDWFAGESFVRRFTLAAQLGRIVNFIQQLSHNPGPIRFPSR